MDDFRRTPVNRAPQAGTQRANPNSIPPVTPTPPQAPVRPVEPAVKYQSLVASPQPIDQSVDSTPTPPPTKRSKKKIAAWSVLGFILLLIGFAATTVVWFNGQLAPVDASQADKKVVKIESGSTPDHIAQILKDEGLIRSELVFLWQARIEGVQNNLQAGSYRLSPSETTPEIIEHLSNGKVDTFSITFLPGATLADNRKVLLSAGYTEREVDTALSKTYTSPLFESKPAGTDLEGYIYGETYSFGSDVTVEGILEYTFEYFYGVIKDNNLIAKYAQQDLTLYEGITLASIVQREASPGGDDMPQIARVFFNRIDKGMTLGSDVTYQYIADKEGLPRDTNLDSPYNTRRYTGLPPGPIATPGKKALLAVGKIGRASCRERVF